MDKMRMLLMLSCVFALPLFAVEDAMEHTELKNVRLYGGPSKKMNAFFYERMQSEFAQKEIFGEARRAFETRDDDSLGDCGGRWRGEFWGKLMLSTARAADYLQNRQLTQFVKDECHRMMALQDDDGYLGSYKNKELVNIVDYKKTCSVYGWGCCWNIWNRKYAMWGMLMAYKATGDRSILDSVCRQMDQLIDMMHRLGLKLKDTGATEMNGLPSMSILKPLLMLYHETGNEKYLAYAKEMLPDWDRDDGACPNFFRNCANGKILSAWYPEPWNWAKAYEMMSCLDGLVEYYRVTGDRKVLETVIAIRDNLYASERNPFGGVGFCDKFINAAKRPNAVSEVCDAIHWIRLNLDLFEVTGDKRFIDTMEEAYFNNFLPGVFRRGDYGCFFVRGVSRHDLQFQCGFSYNHCCVNNVGRTFLDMAEGAITKDRNGVYHVNFYQDAAIRFGDDTFTIEGDYPKGNVITVKSNAKNLEFRRPAWCRKLDIARPNDGTWVLTFDMNPRIVEREVEVDTTPEYNKTKENPPPSVGKWMRQRFANGACYFQYSSDLMEHYRRTPAAEVMYGPLVLAKAKGVGDTADEIFASDKETVYGKGYSVSVKPIENDNVWCAFDTELSKDGAETIRVRTCDFMSAGDMPLARESEAFSIWF